MELINKILTFLETWKTKLTGLLNNAESVIDRTQELIGTKTIDEPVVEEEPVAIIEPETEEVPMPKKSKAKKA